MPRFAGTPVEDTAKKPRFGGVPVPGKPSDYDKGYFAQVMSGVNDGLTSVLGAPVDIANAAVGLGMKGINAVAGTDFKPSEEPLGGSAGLRRSLEDVGSIKPETDEVGKQMARRVAKSVGAAAIPGGGAVAGAAKPVQTGLTMLGSALGGGAGAAVANQVFPDNQVADIVGDMAGSFGVTGVANAMIKRAGTRAAEMAVPTVEQLKAQASDKFDEAHKLGVTASQQQTQSLAADMRKIATDEGLISPTGRVSEAYPKAREALRMIDDYAQGAMTVPQMQTARKTLADAAGSADGAERRMASIMLKQFDDFTAPLAPPLSDARGLYQRAKKAEQIETLSDLAASKAGQFSGSGYENALRTEYRGLERQIIKGQERGFSPEEVDAISKVAQGTRASNTFRNIGKLAPTGPVSFMASAGVPAIVGSAIGGPAVGAGAATLTSLAGYGARGIATKMGARNAELAELLMRNGIPVQKGAGLSRDLRRIAEALLASQTANHAATAAQ